MHLTSPYFLEELDARPGGVSSIAECQLWGSIQASQGANYFHFDQTTEECRMFATMHAGCEAVGGPESAPAVEECAGEWGWRREVSLQAPVLLPGSSWRPAATGSSILP